MKITDEIARKFAREYYADKSIAEDPQIIEAVVSALTAALATQPDRYREGFEKAREMAALAAENKAQWLRGLWMKERQAKMLNEASGADMAASAIRNMEMPDE